MRALLDTRALLWWATLDPKLSRKARAAIADDRTDVYVSAASAWEIATKVRIGKLVWPATAGSVADYVVGQAFRPLPISVQHAERAGLLRIEHRDPFDRMLVAQALTDDLVLLSNEAVFDAAGVRRYW